MKKLKTSQTSTVTKKEAISELEKLLSDKDYDPLDNPWLESFIKKFSIQGVGAIDEFSSKFGERDLKKIKKAIMDNSKLLGSEEFSTFQNFYLFKILLHFIFN